MYHFTLENRVVVKPILPSLVKVQDAITTTCLTTSDKNDGTWPPWQRFQCRRRRGHGSGINCKLNVKCFPVTFLPLTLTVESIGVKPCTLRTPTIITPDGVMAHRLTTHTRALAFIVICKYKVHIKMTSKWARWRFKSPASRLFT